MRERLHRLPISLFLILSFFGCKNPLGDESVVDEGGNLAPTVSSIAAQAIYENASTSALSFTIEDKNNNLSCSSNVSMSSSNATLIDDTDVVFSGTTPNCSATLTPNSNQSGNSTITLTVSNGTLSSSISFNLTVTAIVLTTVTGAYEFNNGEFAVDCKTYINHSAYNSEGDGLYRIDPDGSGGSSEYVVYCDMTYDNGGWTRIFHHNVSTGVFASRLQAENINQSDPTNLKYSILDQVSLFDAAPFEFYMTWPGNVPCGTTPHQWTQTSNPMTNTESVTGYVNIVGATTNVSGTAGLCLSSQGNTLLDGNCGHGNWWYSVGIISLFGGGFPGCSNAASELELYVR